MSTGLHRLVVSLGGVAVALALNVAWPALAAQVPAAATQSIDLAARLAARTVRGVNRTVTRLEGPRPGVHLGEGVDAGVAWIDATDFTEGTIEVDVRGKDVLQQSFLGIAFHRKDDATYEAVYLRPFNFKATDPARHQHAVQYVSVPAYDWPRLRQEFPEEFENPVDASLSPTDWVRLRVVVAAKTVQIFAGAVTTPTLDVKKLGDLSRGQIGLWVGNNSDGDFSNLRVTPVK